MYTTELKRPEVRSDAESWTPLLYRVRDKLYENKNNITLLLEPDGDSAIEELKPGQFNMLYAYGTGEIPISVSSLQWEHPLICHTIQDVGPVSHKCFILDIGQKIGVRGPFGSSWPIEAAHGKDVVVMAGGVGIAPLRPLIESIGNDRFKFKRVNVLYGSRNPHSILFHTDVISWQSDPLINFQVTVDHSQRNWRGNVGMVTNLVNLASFNPDETVAFVCGPEIMMRFSVYSLIDAGVDENNIYVSMERNMKCGIGHCGHCQWGPLFICKDGPVFRYPDIKSYLNINEL